MPKPAVRYPVFVALHVSEEELTNLIPLIPTEKNPEGLTPLQHLAIRIVAGSLAEPGECMVCGCTAEDCSQCVERTGAPCSWVNENETLCSACLTP